MVSVDRAFYRAPRVRYSVPFINENRFVPLDHPFGVNTGAESRALHVQVADGFCPLEGGGCLPYGFWPIEQECWQRRKYVVDDAVNGWMDANEATWQSWTTCGS